VSLPPGPNDEEARIRRALQRIAAGIPKVQNDKAPDSKDKKEEDDLVKAAKRSAVENDWLLIGLRKIYGYCLVVFMWIYFIVTFTLIILNSYSFYGMRISNTILVAACCRNWRNCRKYFGSSRDDCFRIVQSSREKINNISFVLTWYFTPPCDAASTRRSPARWPCRAPGRRCGGSGRRSTCGVEGGTLALQRNRERAAAQGKG
jgi:hypothetical protein